MNEENIIDRKKYSKNLTKKYLPEKDYSFIFYEETKDKIFEIIKKILKSKAAKDFFNEVYKNKYDKNNQIIEYHFYRDEILEEIFKKIEFYPIFDSKIKSNTNLNDLTIIINSIPGEFDLNDEINDFNKTIES